MDEVRVNRVYDLLGLDKSMDLKAEADRLNRTVENVNLGFFISDFRYLRKDRGRRNGKCY